MPTSQNREQIILTMLTLKDNDPSLTIPQIRERIKEAFGEEITQSFAQKNLVKYKGCTSMNQVWQRKEDLRLGHYKPEEHNDPTPPPIQDPEHEPEPEEIPGPEQPIPDEVQKEIEKLTPPEEIHPKPVEQPIEGNIVEEENNESFEVTDISEKSDEPVNTISYRPTSPRNPLELTNEYSQIIPNNAYEEILIHTCNNIIRYITQNPDVILKLIQPTIQTTTDNLNVNDIPFIQKDLSATLNKILESCINHQVDKNIANSNIDPNLNSKTEK